MWDYLSQFWDAITEVGSYTVEWFQNIGNAVAGAVGGMFDWLIHYMNDFFILMGWAFTIIRELVKTFTLPVSYVFNFLKSFTISAFSDPQIPEASYSFSSETMEIFQSLPYWNVITTVLGVSVLIIIGVAIFKLFLKIT